MQQAFGEALLNGISDEQKDTFSEVLKLIEQNIERILD